MEEGSSTEKLFPYLIDLRASLRCIFLIHDGCGKAQLTVGSATPEQVILDGMRNGLRRPQGTNNAPLGLLLQLLPVFLP